MAASKDTMLAYLAKHQPMFICPEGTWNLTDSLPLMPMKWGIIDVARESGAQIIPVILEYDHKNKKCFARFSEPMTFAPEDNKADAIAALRDTMATIRREFWERKGTYSRAEMDVDAERSALRYSIEEYPPIDWEYEKSCIYHPHTEPEEAFEHLNKLIPCRENAFLFI